MKPSRRSARLTTSRRTFPRRKWRRGLLSMLLTHPRFYSVVAEDEGRIVGSNFLDERSCIAGVGPITVDPTGQNRGVGGRLMQDVLDRAARQQAAGVRLLQAGFHNRSLCLYTKLGFRTREPMSILQGKPLGQSFRAKRSVLRRPRTWPLATGSATRSMGSIAMVNCATRSARRPHRSSNNAGASPATRPGSPFLATASRRRTSDLLALIGAAPEFGGPGFLLPTRNHEVFKWCLEAGLKLVSQMTLMTIGSLQRAHRAIYAVCSLLMRSDTCPHDRVRFGMSEFGT